MKYEILLADDDDSVRLVLHKALTRAGHSVKATDNAETLVKWAEMGQGDIVVTDVMMGGKEVFDSLPRLTKARPKLPVIIISANNTVNTALKSGQHKVFEYVPKPFDLDDVTNPDRRPRIISATRKDLRDLVEEGVFRDDLLFRINVAEIKIPNLAERDRDTYELAEAFLAQASTDQARRFETEALDVLHRHKWTGNVRELENLVRRLAVLYSDDVITADMVLQEFSKDLPPLEKAGAIQNRLEDQLEEACRGLLDSEREREGDESAYTVALAWVERPLIVEALRLTGGNRAKAADKLGIHRNTLRTRLKSLDID